MESPGNSGSIPRDQKCASSPETKSTFRTRQGTKLRDILKCDKPVKTNLPYADFEHNITRKPDVNLPKYVGSQQSQVSDRRFSKEDELVRYMSNLPSYLEKGKNYQDKALNVGVLDWRRLEKWQCSQKQMPGQQSGCSPSSSSSSIFSTDGSSAHSSRGLSCSPTRQRVHRLSLQSTVEESPKKTHVRNVRSSSGRGNSCSPAHQRMHSPVPKYHPQKVCPGGSTSPDIGVFGRIPQKFQDSPVSTGNHFSRQQRVLGALQLEREESDLMLVSEMGKQKTLDKFEVGAPWKGKSNTQGVESGKETIRSQEMKFSAANQDFSLREKSGHIFMPRDLSNLKCSSLTDIASFTADGRLSVDPCQKSILGRSNHEADILSKNDHKKQLEPSESSFQHANGIKSSSQHSNIPLHPTPKVHSSCKKNANGISGAPQASHMLSFPARILSSPSRCRNAEEKRPAVVSKSEIAVQASEEVAARRSSASIPKARNPSPIQRLGSAVGKMIKNAGSRDNSPVRRSSSKECVTKSGSEKEFSLATVSNPYCDKLSTTNNRRPSPLRRLLDPLIKPRASTCSEPSKKHLSSMIGTINSCNEPLDLSVNTSTASDSTALLAQALLQVSFKNGLPMFTFAIDNESNILGATVSKFSVPGKGHHSWTYTFFIAREKRKSGIWLSQGSKGDCHGYVQNVMAQMKVSDTSNSFTKPDNADYSITREFDLFAVDGDQYGNDFHPTNELAAIVVKLPSTAELESETKDGESSFNWLETAQDSRNNLQELRSANSADHSLKSPNLSSTVILPGGVHTVPSKGEISTLAERWRSGGSCDCGGWDLGCQLRVYTNKKEHERRTSSSGSCLNKDMFRLFSQGNQDSQSILSLAPFKERIYSVEFSSSLSLLQAFAICVSFIDCRRPAEVPEPSVVVKKITEACIFEVAMLAKTSNQGESPGNYVSNPPHSPVGRV